MVKKSESQGSIPERPGTPARHCTPPSPAEQEGFVERWSRRKAEQRGSLHPAPPAAHQPTTVATTVDDKAELTDADMPPIASLGPDSDFSVFMGRKVSEELRLRALRKLFHLPQYQVRCTLNEYEGNFNDFLPLGNVVTREMREMLQRQLLRSHAAGGAQLDTVPCATAETAAAQSGPAPQSRDAPQAADAGDREVG